MSQTLERPGLGKAGAFLQRNEEKAMMLMRYHARNCIALAGTLCKPRPHRKRLHER